MELDDDEKEFSDHPVFSRVLGMFDGNPSFQRILRLGLRAELESNDDEEIYYIDKCTELPFPPGEYLKASNWSSDGKYTGELKTPANAVKFPNLASAMDHLHSASAQSEDKDTGRRGGALQEGKQYASKAERKRMKKQKQKEKKQQEQLEKEKQNLVKNDEEDGAQAEESESGHGGSKSNSSPSKQQALAKDTDSSDGSDESSDLDGDTKYTFGNFEELDMTSSFVSKAADIARRKMELKPKKEKKKSPVKEEAKSSPEKEAVVAKKGSAVTSSLSFEDNVKISTDLANTGNKFAGAGDFSMAVKYFTDAIKYNPTEFKLFGNRSFCFEKMQEYEKALADAELSLSMRPGWVKGLFRKGRALAGLKRYNEACLTFREVLKLDGSYAEAAQELMRVQITQLMGYGFSREQSSNALIIHGTVERALEVLSKLNNQPGTVKNGALPPPQVANISGVSPVLSATNPALHSQNAPKAPLKNRPLVLVQNTNVQITTKPVPNEAARTNNTDPGPAEELFPVWVGNLFHPVAESDIKHLFTKAGVVHSVKLLSFKRCAFVNFTKQEHCDEAIRRFHGFDLNGAKIIVRYPDRIPEGMGMSKSALKADDLLDENTGYEYGDGRYAARGRRPFRPYRPTPGGLYYY
ncbi:STI1-like protein [Cheilinus undulatus]|uniref:STI1-like protein n=1 Tax=Cheilinus undulatus TaxID=241271 RepID=UPI001BD493C5|nr:STI1-like protein [Cheilinus undulatus]